MRLAYALLWTTVAGCSSRYYVRPQHYAAAQQVQATTGRDVAIPALDRDREPTFVRVGRIGRTLQVDPYGLLEVRASDSRTGLSIAGWTTAGIGGLLAIIGASLMPVEDTDQVVTILFVQSGVFLGAGIALLAIGYSSDGPETPGPSPGMPSTVGLPSRYALRF